MRCHRLNATITTAHCLRMQEGLNRMVPVVTHLSERVPPAHPCRGCSQAEAARKGELNDMDVEQIKKESQPSKVCATCGETKAVTDFYTTPSGKLENQCKKCKHAAAVARRQARRFVEGKPVKDRKPKVEPRPDTAPTITREAVTLPATVRFRIDIGGHSIELCQECLRRHLML